MFCLTASNQYYLYCTSADMRKGFDSLCGVVRSCIQRDPLSGEVFIFINRTRTVIKLLHWEEGGLVIYHKRLERGCFTLPRFDKKTCSYVISWRELVLMVEGISVKNAHCKRRYKRM